MSRHATPSVRRWKNSSVHREVDNTHARRIWRVVLGVAIALAPFAVYLLQTMSYVQTSYAIEHLRSEEVRLMEADRRYRVERAMLESLPAVEARAGGELSLEHPPASHVVVVSRGELPGSAPPGRTPNRLPPR